MDFLYPTLLPLVATVMVLVIMVTYVGGKVFRIPQMEAYFNIELYNIVFAILLVASAFAVFAGLDAVARQLLCGASPDCQYSDPIEASKSFLNAIINRGVLPMYKDLLVIEAGTSLSNSFMYRVGPSVWSFAYKVEPGADAILSLARMMSFGLLAIYGSLSVQYIGMSLIGPGMPIALSLGMILFIFQPTREAGAFLMSFAFAFQAVFPFTYALHQVILNDMWSAGGLGNAAGEGTYDAYTPEIFGWRMRGASTVVAYLVPFASLTNFVLLIPFINAMAHLALISLFLPALSIMITIAFINATTKFLLGRT